MDMITLGQDLRVKASGGDALILNPVTMEVLGNDVVSDEWVHLPTGAQLMLSGMYNNDVFLVVVSEEGDFSNSQATYGLILRRASWAKVQEVGAVS